VCMWVCVYVCVCEIHGFVRVYVSMCACLQVKHLADREVTKALGKDRHYKGSSPQASELVDLIVWLLINSMKQVHMYPKYIHTYIYTHIERSEYC
jgi:hypothetical protein